MCRWGWGHACKQRGSEGAAASQVQRAAGGGSGCAPCELGDDVDGQGIGVCMCERPDAQKKG